MSRIDYNKRINDINSQLIVTDDDLKAYSLLDFNIDPEKLIPYILEAQQLRLEPIIGTPFYRKLQDPDRGYEYDYLVTFYVTQALVSWALGIYIKRARYQIAEGGIFSHFSEDSETVAVSEVRVLAKEHEHNAETYARKMVSFIHTYKEHYPEWDQAAHEGYGATQQVHHLGGWVVDNKRGGPYSWLLGTGPYSGWCPGITKDPNFFVVTFWWGTNTTTNAGFDPDTLQNKEQTLPVTTQVQPADEYVWFVSTTDFDIYHGNVKIPVGSLSDPVTNGETYLKTFIGGRYWVRSTIRETYEQLTLINVKTT